MTNRLDQEQKVREEDKRRKLVARQDLLRMQKELERFNVIMAEDVLMELTPAARQGMFIFEYKYVNRYEYIFVDI